MSIRTVLRASTALAAVAAIAVVAVLAATPDRAAAATPAVYSVVEGRDVATGGTVLVLLGKNLATCKSFTLTQADGVAVDGVEIRLRNKDMLVLGSAQALPQGTYTLALICGKNRLLDYPVTITDGAPLPGTVEATALSPALRTDLDDAQTLGGHPSSWFAPADHNHDLRYHTKTEDDALYAARSDLSNPGTINNPSNPVDWSRLKNVPAGFADGTDDGANYSAGPGISISGSTLSVVFSGTGTNPTAARSDHLHDSRYFTQQQLSAAGGTINDPSNPVDWSRLKNVPSGFADGVDNVTNYVAGAGISISGTTLSAAFGGNGTAATASHSDHNHDQTYAKKAGDVMSGTLSFPSMSGQAISVTSSINAGSTGAVNVTANSGTAVHGHGHVGVIGDLDSGGVYGVEGLSYGANQTAVYGYSYLSNSTGVKGTSAWAGIGVRGDSYAGVGVYGVTTGSAYYSSYYGSYVSRVSMAVKAVAKGASSMALYAEAQGTGGTALVANNTGGSGDVAVFQSGGTNCARIALNGTGYFDGGTQTSGADFAENVRVDRVARALEPGDVLVIDPTSPRRFSLSAAPDSALVAGVYSTKPGVLARPGRVADRAELADRAGEEAPLAVVGIVPTKVCAEGGPIRIGDLLVTSSTPGRAKRAPPQPAVGTVLGKALGALESGDGVIEVLLMAR
jgi:hypothetical protein